MDNAATIGLERWMCSRNFSKSNSVQVLKKKPFMLNVFILFSSFHRARAKSLLDHGLFHEGSGPFKLALRENGTQQ